MGLKDLLITPFYLLLLTIIAARIRPYVTTPQTRKYFLPALWVRFVGAILLGLVYQFYYNGGDTFNYWEHGSQWIWKAFFDDPGSGFKLLFTSGGEYLADTFNYSQRIWYYSDPKSYIVVRIAAFFDILTFGTYSSTALFFALISFSGAWAMYTSVQKLFPAVQYLAITMLFVPSVIFWGSGIMKDTLTLGALGWLTWALLNIIECGNRNLRYWVVAILSSWFILSIKSYIIICYLPLVFLWIYWNRIKAIKSMMIKISIAPVLLLVFLSAAYLSLQQVSLIDQTYSLNNIAQKAMITAYDIRYGWGARTGGEGGYDLGVLDGTWQSMLTLMPAAINVSLFRPYFWETRNILMLFSAMESTIFLLLTVRILFYRNALKQLTLNPFIFFCFTFAILFAFAVGVSTYNFGTLMRYKIPMMPFYLIFVLNQFNTKVKIHEKSVRIT